MKKNKLYYPLCPMLLLSFFLPIGLFGQEQASDEKVFVRPPFESSVLIDNQTTVIPTRNTLQFNIQHRFGRWNNGYDDFYGLWAPSNIRMGFSYSLLDRLQLGVGLTKNKKILDLNGKYVIMKQTQDGRNPVSIAYYGNMAISTMSKDNFELAGYRVSYFSQLILSRKINYRISLQVAPSLTHYNFVLSEERKNEHIAITGSGRVMLWGQNSFIVNYDQPITTHRLNNPNPNLAFGLELATSGHAFQIFIGNYGAIAPQENNMYNFNNYLDNEFLIGFNITRLWNL